MCGKRFINSCISLLEDHPIDDYYFQIAALGIRGNSIVSRGYNRDTGNPEAKRIADKYGIEKQYDHSKNDFVSFKLHAEQDAIKRADGKIDKLIIARLTPGGVLACSKPCLLCQSYLFEYNVNKVIYSTDGKFVERGIQSFPLFQ